MALKVDIAGTDRSHPSERSLASKLKKCPTLSAPNSRVLLQYPETSWGETLPWGKPSENKCPTGVRYFSRFLLEVLYSWVEMTTSNLRELISTSSGSFSLLFVCVD